MEGWEKFTLKAGRQVQNTGKSRCAAADNDTDPLCVAVCLLAANQRSFTLVVYDLVKLSIIYLACCSDNFSL